MSSPLFINNWNERVKMVQVACGTTYTKIDLEGATRVLISPGTPNILFLLSSDGEDVTIGIPFGMADYGATNSNYPFEGATSIGIGFSGDNPSLWVVSTTDATSVCNVTLFFAEAPGANTLDAPSSAAEPSQRDKNKDLARSLLSGGLF